MAFDDDCSALGSSLGAWGLVLGFSYCCFIIRPDVEDECSVYCVRFRV